MSSAALPGPDDGDALIDSPSALRALLTPRSGYPTLDALVRRCCAVTAAEVEERCQWWLQKHMKLPEWIAPLFILREKQLAIQTYDEHTRKCQAQKVKPSKYRGPLPRLCTRLNDTRGGSAHDHNRASCLNWCECVLCESREHGAFWRNNEPGSGTGVGAGADGGGKWVCPFQSGYEREIAQLAARLHCDARVAQTHVDNVITWQRANAKTNPAAHERWDRGAPQQPARSWTSTNGVKSNGATAPASAPAPSKPLPPPVKPANWAVLARPDYDAAAAAAAAADEAAAKAAAKAKEEAAAEKKRKAAERAAAEAAERARLDAEAEQRAAQIEASFAARHAAAAAARKVVPTPAVQQAASYAAAPPPPVSHVSYPAAAAAPQAAPVSRPVAATMAPAPQPVSAPARPVYEAQAPQQLQTPDFLNGGMAFPQQQSHTVAYDALGRQIYGHAQHAPQYEYAAQSFAHQPQQQPQPQPQQSSSSFAPYQPSVPLMAPYHAHPSYPPPYSHAHPSTQFGTAPPPSSSSSFSSHNGTNAYAQSAYGSFTPQRQQQQQQQPSNGSQPHTQSYDSYSGGMEGEGVVAPGEAVGSPGAPPAAAAAPKHGAPGGAPMSTPIPTPFVSPNLAKPAPPAAPPAAAPAALVSTSAAAPAASSQEVRTVRVRVFLPGVTEGKGKSACGDSFAELFEELDLPVDSNLRFSLQQPTAAQPQPPALTEPQLWSLAKNTPLYAYRYFCAASFAQQHLVNPRLQQTDVCALCALPLSHAAHHPPADAAAASSSSASVPGAAGFSPEDVRTVRVRVFLPGVTEGKGEVACGDSFAELLEELELPPDSNLKFSLQQPTAEQPQPPALTEPQLWTLAKNTPLYAYHPRCSLSRDVQVRINPQLQSTDRCALCALPLSDASH